MAGSNGTALTALMDELEEISTRFDFFRAIQIIEQAARARGSQRAGPVGFGGHPTHEAARIRTAASRAFPATQLASATVLKQGVEDKAAEVVTTFMGLTGPGGVLPEHYTELVIERIRDHDTALRDFFDLFNHRVLSLYYRAWKKYRPEAASRRASGAARDHPDATLDSALEALVGIVDASAARRLQNTVEPILNYGGYYARRIPSPEALGGMLSDYLGVRAEIRQFVGRWLTIDVDERTRLGRDPASNACLGGDAILGSRVWDVQSSFEVRVGPLTLEQFQRFMPTSQGDLLAAATTMTRTYVGAQFRFRINPFLPGSSVPPLILGGRTNQQPRLGWNTWLSGRSANDVGDEPSFVGDNLSAVC